MHFKYEEIDHPKWKYRVTEDYIHSVRRALDVSSHPREDLAPYFGFADEKVFLNVGYTWNGSNVVVDTKTDMLASAVHDAQCQGMYRGIFKGSLRNWRRAAGEYRRNCIKDGMSHTRAWTRYAGLMIGGGNGYKWRRILQRED